jgi:hypothetical protein
MYDTFGIYDNISTMAMGPSCFESICIRTRDTVISFDLTRDLEAYLVENGRSLIGGSELHSIVTQTLLRAFRTALVTLHSSALPCAVGRTLTIVSLDFAACSSVVVFCTKARFDLRLEGKACGDEYVVVGRFSYAVTSDHCHARRPLNPQEAGSRRPQE